MINDFFDWANRNAGALQVMFAAVQLFFAFVVMLSTAIYVALTGLLVWETRKLRQAETDPEVAVYLDLPPFSFVFDVVVRNIGNGPAYHVSFTLHRELQGPRDEDIAEAAFFRQGIPYLVPGQAMRTMLGASFHLLDESGFEPLGVTVRYFNDAKREFTETFTLDPAVYQGIIVSDKSPAAQVIDAIKKLTESVNKVEKAIAKASQRDRH